MHLSWLDPHKMRKITVVGREKMVVFDDMELERKVTVYEKAPWEPAETLRRVEDPHRRHLRAPKVANDEPLKLESSSSSGSCEDGPGDFREALDGLASCARSTG